jgi:hypothetical protein
MAHNKGQADNAAGFGNRNSAAYIFAEVKRFYGCL